MTFRQDDEYLLPPALRSVVWPLSWPYAAAAGWRRRRTRRPGRQRRLRRPVVSIGSLAVGGSGKTPLVASVADLLVAAGERPSILSRGYAREERRDGVVVVRDFHGIRADLGTAGDEPSMLAHRLDGCAVLVSPDRYLAGVLGEAQLGCTVHVLDDGFQHVRLARDVDLLLVTCADLERGRVVPDGRLRESPAAASVADAWCAPAAEVAALAERAARVGVSRVFGVQRRLGPPVFVEGDTASGTAQAARPVQDPVLLVSGIARPASFEASVKAAGWLVAEHLIFRDHHRFGRRDVSAMAERLRATGAALILTTEKDAVRLRPLRPLPVPVAWVPLDVMVDPAVEFRAWLLERLAAARARR